MNAEHVRTCLCKPKERNVVLVWYSYRPLLYDVYCDVISLAFKFWQHFLFAQAVNFTYDLDGT